jgi:hypothetical protein
VPVLLVELLALMSVLPFAGVDDEADESVEEPEAPMLVPLPIVLLDEAVLSVELGVVVLGAVLAIEPEVLEPVEAVSVLGVVVEGIVLDVEVSLVVFLWHAESDNAATRARAAQRARDVVFIRDTP